MITNSSSGIQVIRDIPPDNLLLGIMACGGIDNYYNVCIAQERQFRSQLNAMQQSQGLTVSAPFPDNAHEVIEQAVTSVGKKRLGIVDDLITAGLTTPLPNWWAIPSLRRGNIGEGGSAHRSMVPDSRGERFVLQRGGTSWPIFCTWANFSFDARTIAVGQRVGAPLDVSHTREATYRVNEAIVDQAWNGLTDDQGNATTIDGLSAPGLLSSTNTWSYATWTGLTGPQIVGEVQDAIEAMRVHFPGPFRMYVPSNYSKILTSDYGAAYAKTIIDRLQELGPWGGKKLEVVIDDTLPANRVVIVMMDPDVVDVVVGQQPVPVSWKDASGWNTFWVVLSCVVVRMFPNSNGEYGVAVGNI